MVRLNDTTPINRYRRRAILRRAGTAGASMALGGGIVGTASAAVPCELPNKSDRANTEDYVWRRANSDYYIEDSDPQNDWLTEIQSGLVYSSSVFIESEDRWFHFFRSFGAGYALRKRYDWSKYKKASTIRFQRLKISNNDPRDAELYTTDGPTSVGAAPSPSTGDNLNFGAAAWTAALAALTLTNTYLAVAIGATQALGVLLDNGESESGQDVTYEYKYEYFNGPCEAVHYASYIFASVVGESHCNFSVNNIITNSGGGGVETGYGVYVDAVPDPIGSSTSITSTGVNSTRPDPGSPNYTEFLVENKMAKRIAFNDIQIPHLRELADGGPVYLASNPVVEITTSSGPV